MSEFVQLHVLVSYPPSNLNRDDLGRPKTAVMGGAQRLRVSSQSLKRAWRTSDIFASTLAGHLGVRTKEMGTLVYRSLTSGVSLAEILRGANDAPATFQPVTEEKGRKWASEIAGIFGKLKSGENALEIEQLAHFSPEEIAAIDALILKLAASGKDPDEDDRKLLMKRHTAADIAMFGRMLAASPIYNTEAAVQVSHAVTVHPVAVEDDYFTAVDDLNRGDEGMGAGHLGETEFASGLFYLYVCVNRDLLRENLGGDEALTGAALRALVEAAAKVAPTGKQNSFASRAYASYLLAEKGCQQPRSLSVAYLKPLQDADLLGSAINALKDTRNKMDAVYGNCSDSWCDMNAHAGEGALQEVLDFVAGHHA
ncbi:type I-E CRISPR-associated protein Cas7/Cse4/CasC [Methanoculleus sp. Wushi-C6]|uniref:Type I-E CRISPR-associated protein Cas7/Cse4/CasC n=1 Tax=Methanoculleus caldifontis TaxID=2651577 RepID=A0ABU3X392_9EURY|nr:type I-E CRISPR-associated protein Cas7/Cse4/CasC [Methanoculleus sp. Wushi-C6]MDV2482240.1 type I-E CRISPR-associated protein Cas7/Cse4/CasC [Methanoculleus sp. Wushi-C6]